MVEAARRASGCPQEAAGVVPLEAGLCLRRAALVDDPLDELAETVLLDLGAPTNATLGTPTSFTLRIDDDDAARAYVDVQVILTRTEAAEVRARPRRAGHRRFVQTPHRRKFAVAQPAFCWASNYRSIRSARAPAGRK